MKRKILIIVFFIIVSFLMVSCLEDVKSTTVETSNTELYLSMFSYRIEDYTDLGLWLFTVEKDEVNKFLKRESAYTLTINDRQYTLKSHKINPNILIAFLDETLSLDQIKNGFISVYHPNDIQIRLGHNALAVEKVIITSDRVEHGTDIYELSLEDYLQLKMDSGSIVFLNGTLNRPAYVKSNEENAYPLQRYYNARQACSEHTTDNAFRFLREQTSHEQLLFLGNANRVSVDDVGNVSIIKPDERDRLRELGTEGVLNGVNTFRITQDDVNNRFILNMDRDVLSQHATYSDAYYFEAQLKSATDCYLTPRDFSDIYETEIPYAEEAGTEVIRNARISSDKKVSVYDSAGEKRTSCNFLSDAVEAAQDGDVVKVRGEFILNESTQSSIQNKELTITSEGYAYALDYTGSATRAFMMDGGASLTIQNAIIQNVTILGTGAAFMLNNGMTFIDNCTLTNNTATGNGGAIYNAAICTVKNSYLTSNHATLKGGAIYNLNTLHFAGNTIASNTADTGANGLYITDNAKVYNSAGEAWRTFNAPQIQVNLIEKRETVENSYSDNGLAEGDWIQFASSTETKAGTLSLSPSTATEFERMSVVIEYQTACFFAEGSITIDTADGFEITADASVNVGTLPATIASVYEGSSNSITIDGITAEKGTKITLTLMADIPTGYISPVSARNITYTFDVTADGDGVGSARTPSKKRSQSFVSFNKSLNTDFRLKSGYDYLRLETDTATEIIYDTQTAEQTRVDSITEALESADGSNQQYRVEGPDGLLNPDDMMPLEATLTITSEHGNTFDFIVYKEYGDFKLSQTNGKYNLYKTFRKAIAGAESGLKYTLESSATLDIKEPEIIIDKAKEILIKPAANVSQIILNADENHRVLSLSGAASVTFKSTTFKKGWTPSNGAGIHLSTAKLYLENCTVEGNRCNGYGAGIYFEGGELTFTNTIVQHNRSNSNGGGIYMTQKSDYSHFQFNSGSVNDNNAMNGRGGGIYHRAGNIFTEWGHWNGAPGEMWGEYNIYFSVDTYGQCHEADLSHPAKVYKNSADSGGSQAVMQSPLD